MKKYLAFSAPLALAIACSSGGGESADTDGDGEISSEEIAEEVEEAAVNITPGQWETTMQFTEFDIPNMPEEMRGMLRQQLGQQQTQTSCITPEEAANPEAGFFNNDNDECEYTDFSMSGGRMLIAGTCSSEEMNGTMRMEGTYTPTSYDMTMNMNMEGGPMGEMTMAGRVQGRHVADECGEGAG